MIFNSFIFVLFFLPFTVAGYYMINKTGHFDIAKLFLLGMSLWFYIYVHVFFLPILIISIVINYGLVLFMNRTSNTMIRKSLVIGGISLNLGSLFYFKYLGFFAFTSNQYLKTSFTVASILLPLGISFFTFQQISYLVDSYRDNTLKYKFLDYSLFVAFFSKITQGPIAFHHELIPQFNDESKKQVNYENISKGLVSFSFGLAKKMLLADNLGAIADWGYGNIPALGTTNALLVMLAYTLQIYFDFSGYCDMATGICLFFNIDLVNNFDSPYKSLSISEFWKRWHITLTRFFRQYVYFPLGGNRKGKIRTYINMFIVFLLSGLWHGAALTFILWGVLHGIGICLSKLCEKYTSKLPRYIRWLATFIFVNLAWVFFRSESITYAIVFLKQLFSWNWVPISAEMVILALPTEANLIQYFVQHYSTISIYYTASFIIVVFILFSIFASAYMKNTQQRVAHFKPNTKELLLTLVLLLWSILSFSEVGTFLYINF